jgi:hypothetical protein
MYDKKFQFDVEFVRLLLSHKFLNIVLPAFKAAEISI